jgi:hypothetical protein
MAFSDFLRSLVTDTSYRTWEETAMSWLLTVIVVAVVWTILWILIKIGFKLGAAHPVDRGWKRSSAWGYIFLGFLPITLTMFWFWYASEDFYKVANVGGLVKGILLAWFLYLLLQLISHLIFRPWRNEL